MSNMKNKHFLGMKCELDIIELDNEQIIILLRHDYSIILSGRW